MECEKKFDGIFYSAEVEQSKLLQIAMRGRRSSEDQLPSSVTSPRDHHHLHHQMSFALLQSVRACLA
jgi:hypothetical protein